MVVLNTNTELRRTFERLIKAMKEPVEWNGQFVVIGDYLILHGSVRSLFFNFETRKVQTNLIDIPVREEEILEIGEHTKVQNVLNLVLYAFGKWGLIRGIKVEQDYAQLNRLFESVLEEFSVEPGYARDHFRFYQGGVRLTYEDVVMLSLEEQEEAAQLPQEEEMEAGLWHNLIWQKRSIAFTRTDTTLEERRQSRIGQNFYMVGCQCPKCRRHLHMAVFPEGDEFRIETAEGGVFIARAYTCETCRIFYTPRPQKLLSEGDIYFVEFLGDEQAYEDYKELLGAKADRVSNCRFNEYEEIRKRKDQLLIREPGESLEEVCTSIMSLSDEELSKVEEQMEEGFYPEQSIQRLETAVQAEGKRRLIVHSMDKADWTARRTKESADSIRKAQKAHKAHKTGIEAAAAKKPKPAPVPEPEPVRIPPEEAEPKAVRLLLQSAQQEPKKAIPEARRMAAKKRYEAKCGILGRLSLAQVLELKKELLKDKNLYDTEKEAFLAEIIKQEGRQKRERLHSLADGCRGQDYEAIRHAIGEIAKIDLPQEEKDAVLKPLYEEKKKRAETESDALIRKMPDSLDLKQYHAYVERLKGYAEADLAPHEEFLEQRRKSAQTQEICNLMRRAKALERPQIMALSDRLKGQGFDGDILEPFLAQLEEKLREADENTIAEICGNPAKMGIEETMDAYEKIKDGIFLPELKTNALEMLKKRLEKLKTEECELLVQKLKNDLEGRIAQNDRHHFYPAKRVWTKEAAPKEYEVIQFALDTYGTSRGLFEYPIFVADTSRDRSGKDGMILTPEHLFYRTMLNAFAVPIKDIEKIHSQTGFLHTGLFMEMRNGTRIKIPYVVDRKEIVAWGNCLEEFIEYLKEKPDSRNLSYLARDTHETICCFRCGYAYTEGNVCPKCGYKMNR